MKKIKAEMPPLLDENLNEGYEVLLIENAFDIDCESGYWDATWYEIIDRFSEFEIRDNKNGSAFLPVAFLPESQWTLSKPKKKTTKPNYRHDGNISAITMAVIDLDEPGALKKALKIYGQYEHIIHSTHSYQRDDAGNPKEKFRMIMPLESPIDKADWPIRFREMIAGINADQVCGNLSRTYYLPSMSNAAYDDQKLKPYFKYQGGPLLNEAAIQLVGERFAKELGERGVVFRAKISTSAAKKYLQNGSNADSVLMKRIRHFSGTYINVPVKQAKNAPIPKVTLDDFYQRHAKTVDKLIANKGHHAFALSVTASEIFRFRENANMRKTIEFLFDACDQHSDRPLDSGDTLIELPGLMISAYQKSCPLEFEKKLAYFDDDLGNALEGFADFIEQYSMNILQQRHASQFKPTAPVALKAAPSRKAIPTFASNYQP